MPTNPTDADLLDFLDECGWEPSTMLNARSVLVRWQAWLATRTPAVAVMDATHRDLRAYLAEREAAGVGPNTRHKQWQIIGAVYAWAARPIGGEIVTSGRYKGKRLPGAGILTVNPMLRAPAPTVPETPTLRYATAADVDALIANFLAAARARRADAGTHARALRNAAMVSLMFRSGCRVGELPWIDIDHLVRDEGGAIVACRVGGDDGTKTKNGTARLVAVATETHTLLERYLRRRGTAAGPLFAGRAAHTAALDGRLTAQAIREVVDRAAAKLGIVISPHDMRRQWAVEMTRAGVDGRVVKRLAGWSSDKIYNRYLGPEVDRLAVDEVHATLGSTHTRPARLRVVGA